jgi:hypothetical protein
MLHIKYSYSQNMLKMILVSFTPYKVCPVKFSTTESMYNFIFDLFKLQVSLFNKMPFHVIDS